MEKHPKISVIVPVYNAEKYLHRCIDSILAQTFTDLELLLIDDGSRDNSGVICDEYAKKDSRVRVFHKENGGVSSARNMGIENSIGKYIAFIDSDDYVDKDYLEQFVLLLPADLIIQSVRDFHKESNGIRKQYCFQTQMYENDFYELFAKFDLYSFGEPWARLFDSDIIKKYNLNFNVSLHYREDELFFLSYLIYCNVVKTSSYSGYHYLYYSTSATSKYYGFEHNYKVITSIYLQNIKLGNRKNFPSQFYEVVAARCMISFFRCISTFYLFEMADCKYTSRISAINEMKSFIKKHGLSKMCHLTGKYKLLFFPSFVIDSLFRIRNIFKNGHMTLKTD